ncbi:HNH endonuclease signature motif containing protein [Pseudomonas syringae pv. actinidiae]|nr:HNH endonuclease signature motif containing protein [Pseudomonas syringae pv. actinidiae]
MAKPKKIRMSKALKERLNSHVKQGRKKTVYRMMLKKFSIVPCFLCERHVEEKHCTLEHVIPYADGGTDDLENLSISHHICNQRRQRMPLGSPEFMELRAVMSEKHKKQPSVAEVLARNALDN